SLALVQAQRLIQKVPITSCPVPIAPPPVGDRPNQRVQRSWLEVLQRQPTGPLTRQLFVQPLQQFPQGRLQELGALLAHVFLQSLEAPTIRRYSKDSAELLHKLGVHGRPHILSRSGALCEVSLFSRQVANPAWTASYPQKTLLYRLRRRSPLPWPCRAPYNGGQIRQEPIGNGRRAGCTSQDKGGDNQWNESKRTRWGPCPSRPKFTTAFRRSAP